MFVSKFKFQAGKSSSFLCVCFFNHFLAWFDLKFDLKKHSRVSHFCYTVLFQTVVLHYLSSGSVAVCFPHNKEHFFVPLVIVMKVSILVTGFPWVMDIWKVIGKVLESGRRSENSGNGRKGRESQEN